MIRVTEYAFDPAKEIAAFEKSMIGAGGIVTFLGKVRKTTQDEQVVGLYLEHFPDMTERSITKICNDARARWPLQGVCVIHRYGLMKPDDPIVLVCTASTHRRDAFEAADFLMDFLKTKALFWKKEITQGGHNWIEPRSDDYQDVNRWHQQGD